MRASNSTSSAASILVSDARSRFEVASSRTRTLGCARNARAKRDQLPLTRGEGLAALVDDGVEPVRHPFDDLGQPDLADRFPDLVIGGIGTGEGDVVAEGPGEEERLLRHDPELPAERVDLDVFDVVPVDQDPTLGRVVEAGDQLGHCRLPGACLADERHGLAGGDPQVHVHDHRSGGVVAEGHVIEDDLSIVSVAARSASGSSATLGSESNRLRSLRIEA